MARQKKSNRLLNLPLRNGNGLTAMGEILRSILLNLLSGDMIN